MTIYGKIAEKLAKRRATFATLRAPSKDGLDILCETMARYPTVSLLCGGPLLAIIVGALLWLAVLLEN